jgi:hypothetical protein
MQMSGGCHYFQSWKDIENLTFSEVIFMSETRCPEVLEQFFENSETELWLSFAHSQASIFDKTK